MFRQAAAHDDGDVGFGIKWGIPTAAGKWLRMRVTYSIWQKLSIRLSRCEIPRFVIRSAKKQLGKIS